MIASALIFVLATIALAAYNGYIRESHYTTMRTTINQLRIPIEDTRLEDGSYGPNVPLSGFTEINGRFALDPDLDFGPYDYTVSVVSTTSYDVWGSYNSDVWIRCENRANACCSSNASNNPANACD